MKMWIRKIFSWKKRMSCKFHIIPSGQIICVIYRISTFKIFYKIQVNFKNTFKLDFLSLGFWSFSAPHLFIILPESIFFFFRNFRFSHFIFTSCSMCSACQFLLRACKHILVSLLVPHLILEVKPLLSFN